MTRPMRSAKLANLVPALVCALFIQACGLGDRDDVLVLVRANDPVSRSIGDFYASSRDIPAENVLALDLSARANAHNIDVATFEAEIAGPLESYLETHDPERRISLLVTTRGIPLRIGDCPRTDPHYPRHCRSAAVDAALASLGRLAPARSTSEENANPFFADARSFEDFRSDEPDSSLRFLVARLTGPQTPLDPESGVPLAIRELIAPRQTAAGTNAMEARDDPPTWQVFANGPVETRPAALAALLDPAVDVLERRGQRVCEGCRPSGRTAGLLMQDEPSPEQAKALPARLGDPGLVITLNGPETPAFDAFVARWLERGARAISTHLGDPSLGGVTRPAVQLRDWTEGRTAVEAHFRSVPHLGWVNVFVGDPLLALADASPDELDDRDGDGVPDRDDNCLTVPNPAQRDSNGDRVGNRCDPDVDDDGRVVTSWGRIYPVEVRGDLELIALTAQNGPHDPDHDLDGDGRVDENDVALAQLWLFRRPGPSQPADSLTNERR